MPIIGEGEREKVVTLLVLWTELAAECRCFCDFLSFVFSQLSYALNLVLDILTKGKWGREAGRRGARNLLFFFLLPDQPPHHPLLHFNPLNHFLEPHFVSCRTSNGFFLTTLLYTMRTRSTYEHAVADQMQAVTRRILYFSSWLCQ